MEEQTIYQGTEEIREAFREVDAIRDLRDAYVKFHFLTYPLALKCTRKLMKANELAWQKVYKLYPELMSKKLQHESNLNIIRVI